MTVPEARIRDLPVWDGPVSIEPLVGGLSNESYRVRDSAGEFVVRFGKEFPFHHVDRQREIMTARAAHAAGFAPEVVFAEPGVMVSRFIDARTFAEADVRDNLAGIVTLTKRFHTAMPRHVSGPGFMFWVFHVIRDYARTLEQGNSRMTPRLPDFLALAEELEESQAPLPIVFGHNDLLPANFLSDGKRLWIIDFEYAGYSTAMFDLAGIASNSAFDEKQSAELLGEYFGRKPERDLLRSHSAMQCASLLREAMWSMVSEIYLDAPGADYVAYTQDNLDRLAAVLDRHRIAFGKA